MRMILLAPLFLSGCINAAEIQALAADPNPACLQITSMYFTIVINRIHGCDPVAIIQAAPTPVAK